MNSNRRAAAYRPLNQRGGQVYFATDGEEIKVGFSTYVAGRLPRLSFKLKKQMALIAAFDGYLEDEETFHTLFRHLKVQRRRNRDWYPRCQEIFDIIELLQNADAGVTNGRPSVTQVLSKAFCS